MVDVIHYLFETDSLPPSAETAEARDLIRKSIYGELYKRDYKYGSSSSKTQMSGNPEIDYPLDENDIPVPVDPFERSRVAKPYIPPTSFDESSSSPFGSALDAPLR